MIWSRILSLPFHSSLCLCRFLPVGFFFIFSCCVQFQWAPLVGRNSTYSLHRKSRVWEIRRISKKGGPWNVFRGEQQGKRSGKCKKGTMFLKEGSLGSKSVTIWDLCLGWLLGKLWVSPLSLQFPHLEWEIFPVIPLWFSNIFGLIHRQLFSPLLKEVFIFKEVKMT